MSVVNKLLSNSIGDTIVEVLIVLAILGSGIAISYASVSKSLLLSQDAQERNQTTQLLQSQIEDVRTAIVNPNSSLGQQLGQVLQQGDNFCFDVSTNPLYPYSLTAANITQITTSSFPSQCTQGYFRYYITLTHPNSSDSIYTATCQWPNILGSGGWDENSLVYQVYAPTTM